MEEKNISSLNLAHIINTCFIYVLNREHIMEIEYLLFFDSVICMGKENCGFHEIYLLLFFL